VAAVSEEPLASDRPSVDETPSPPRPKVWRSFSVHAAALAALLLVLVPLFDDGWVASPDEGVYSAQAANLADGSWASPRPARDVDVDGEFDGLTGAFVRDGEHVPYSRHPAYPLVLAPFYALAGTTGLVLVSALGTWVAAVAAAVIARRFSERFALPTLWLVGIGSPLLFDAYVVIGHALAAALCGTLFVLLAKALEGPRWRWTVAVLPCAVLLSLMRSEGAVVVVATGAALAATAIRFRPHDRARIAVAPLGQVALGVGVAAAGALAFLADDRWSDLITGTTGTGSGSVDRDSNLLAAAWSDLLQPWHGSALTASSSAAIAVLAPTLGALALRLQPKRTLLPLALVGMGAIAAVVRLVESPVLISGLAAAFPALVVGLLLLPGDVLAEPIGRVAALAAALSGVAILATSYGEGGTTQWGGRFFHVLLPIVVPLAVVGLDAGRRRLRRPEVAVAAAAVLVLTAAFSALSLRANSAYRGLSRRTVVGTMDEARSRPSTEAGGSLVVVSPLNASGAGRAFWKQVTDGHPILSSEGLGTLHGILEDAEAAGRREVLVVTDREPEMISFLLGSTLRRLDWAVQDARRIEGTPNWTMWIGEEPI